MQKAPFDFAGKIWNVLYTYVGGFLGHITDSQVFSMHFATWTYLFNNIIIMHFTSFVKVITIYFLGVYENYFGSIQHRPCHGRRG